jgi:hypothetical protein
VAGDLTARERQVAEVLGTRRRQVEEAVRREELLGRHGWAARRLVLSQKMAWAQGGDGWRRMAVTTDRVHRDLMREAGGIVDLIALNVVEDALEELAARGLVQLQQKRLPSSPSMWVWLAPWLP